MSWDEISDVELVKKFKSGQPEAFDAIVRRFQGRVFRLASVWLFDAQYAGDATQEVFLRGFKGLRSFHFRSAPFTWLYRTTRYVCNEFNRKRKAGSLDHEPVDPASGPERQATDEQTAGRVRKLVAVLPKRQHEVVMLRIFEELSVRETASAMGCREGTVKALLHKAKKQLQLHMQETGFER